MTISNNQKVEERWRRLLSCNIPQSSNNSWLPEALNAAVPRVFRNPGTYNKMHCELVLAHMDEDRLDRLVQPLILPQTAAVSRQLVQLGGTDILFSDTAKVAIAGWGKDYQVIPIMREIMQAVSTLLKAHQKGELANPQLVLRALPVLSMCNFVSENEVFRRDLAGILGCSSTDVPGLIRSYKTAALLADRSRVSAIDQRISSDPNWSVWVQCFLQEGNAIIRLSRPATQWEFSQSEVTNGSLTGINQWLFRKE